MALELFIAFIILLAIIIYTLLGGSDLGFGLWDLYSRVRKEADMRRKEAALKGSMTSLWEFNHLWLIMVVVLLFTAFAPAFGPIMTALFVPLMLVILMIVLRGVAFVFRDNDLAANRELWGWVFGGSSLLLAFLLGAAVAALSVEAIEVDDSNIVTSGYFSAWLNPLAIAGGLLAVALCAFLAAVHMTIDTRSDRDLQEYFRQRALESGVATVALGLICLPLAFAYAPELANNLLTWWGLLLLLGTLACGGLALHMLNQGKLEPVWLATPAAVALLLVAWGLARYPYLIFDTHTLEGSASPDMTLQLVSGALIVGLPFVLYLGYYLIRIFKLSGNHADPGQAAVRWKD